MSGLCPQRTRCLGRYEKPAKERKAGRRAGTIVAQLTQTNAASVSRVPELEPPFLSLVGRAEDEKAAGDTSVDIRTAEQSQSCRKGICIAWSGGDAEDLEGVGREGLLEACRKFRPDGGMAFESWAKNYVRNRILDQSRRQQEKTGKTDSFEDVLPPEWEGDIPDMATMVDEEE